jgi:hypothetical protein
MGRQSSPCWEPQRTEDSERAECLLVSDFQGHCLPVHGLDIPPHACLSSPSPRQVDRLLTISFACWWKARDKG